MIEPSRLDMRAPPTRCHGRTLRLIRINRNFIVVLTRSIANLVCFLLLAIAPAVGAAADIAQLEEVALRAAALRVAPSVVSIDTVGGLETIGKMLVGQGPTTGLIVSPDGYIISSAFNFAQQPASILVGLGDGTRLPAKIVAADRSRMLVLLKVTHDKPLPVAEIATPSDVRVGQWSVAVGRTFDAAQVNVSVGIISAVNRVWGKAVQTDAKISPNNYGGPLVDIQGRVLGVLVPLSPQSTTEKAGVEWYDSGIGFAVNMTDIMKVLPRLKQGETLRPGVLGIVIKAGDMFADPVELSGIRPNSPAYKAGLKRGDKLVAVDGRNIDSRAQLSREINRRYAKDSLKVAVLRGSERIERTLELIDQLQPYERPFLGILPRRELADGKARAGVVVRYVYADSPAAKGGVKVGDRIIGIAGEKVVERDDLVSRLVDAPLGAKLALKVERDGKSLDVELLPTTEPMDVPKELPTARENPVGAAAQVPPRGEVPVKVAEHATQFTAYIPVGYDPRVPHGLLVWLHGATRADASKIIAGWKASCDARELIVLVPVSAQDQWQPGDLEAIPKAIEQLRKDYTIDSSRIVVHGLQSGAQLAQRMAATQRELVRGVAIVQSPILGAPENDPAYPLSWWVGVAKQPDMTPGLELLRKAKFAVTISQQGERARYLNDAERDELLGWIDTLDRL